MAERRMFAKSIVLSDAFLDMPMSARCLYFTLGMLADDDGFVSSPKAIMRQCGASQDDMSILLAKRYLLGFDSGVIVIKHWRINNYLRADRYNSTTYLEERDTLALDNKGAYVEGDGIPVGIPSGIPLDDTGKDRIEIGKDNIEKNIESMSDKPTAPSKKKYGQYKHVLLSDDENTKLHQEYGNKADDAITFLDEYIEMKGYKAKSHYLCIRKWVMDALKEKEQRHQKAQGVTKSAQAYNSYQQRDYSSQDMAEIERQMLAKSYGGTI